jgi:hypothetical protein
MIEIKDSYFKASDGNRYFRRNAPAVAVGVHGEKKEPLTQANYLADEGHIKYDLLNGKIKKLKPVEIDWARERKTDVEAHGIVEYFDLGGRAAFNHEKAIKARLKLVRFHIEQTALENILNKDANKVREELKEEGNDARVCSSVWVVMSGELAERFDTSVSLEASGSTPDGLSITAKGGAGWSGSEKITFSPGTVFAYGLHKVKKWDGDKIEEMDNDWQSFG